MKHSISLIATLLALLANGQAISAPAPKNMGAEAGISGVWINQRGSTLALAQNKDQLTGKFTTAVAQTRACIGYPAPITGFINSNALSLSINMIGCGSPVVLSMSGVLMKDKEGKEQIKIQSLTQYKGNESWNSQVLTSDIYTRQVTKN